MTIKKYRPSVGVSVMIVKGKNILLGLRKGSHGQGTWGMPGGHLEWEESFFECAKREVFEELGVNIVCSPGVYFVTNDIFSKDEKHYVTVFVVAKIKNGTLANKEPDKCSKWQWYQYDNLPKFLFLPVKNLLKQKKITEQLFLE